MKVRCERDGRIWEAIPRPYPGAGYQRKDHCKAGDMEITCPRCGRGYFLEDDGRYISDRPLTILEK